MSAFQRYFVDKGAIPYGDHSPFMGYDDNGKNSQAAVLYDLLGDQAAANYFNRMTLASYERREPGHNGHFFGWAWGAPGAARGGEAAAQSFGRNTRWFTELERRHDGSFDYQPQLGGVDHSKYINWSTTGTRLLQYCLPRKKLYITGRGGTTLAPVTGRDLERVVATGVTHPGREHTVEELLEMLGSWSPVVRQKAAEELGNRDEDVVEKLIAMLDSDNRYARYGACMGLQRAGRKSEKAVEALIGRVKNADDFTLRYFAVQALRQPLGNSWENGLREASYKAVPALLELAVMDFEEDPLRKLHYEIAGVLFYHGRARGYSGMFAGGRGLETVDRQLLIPAVKSLLTLPNGDGRSMISFSVYPKLTDRDLEQLWDDIYMAVKYQAPSGAMFAGGVRSNGLRLIAEHGYEEGIDLGFRLLAQRGWGLGGRYRGAIAGLELYGAALTEYLPLMKEKYGGAEHHTEHIERAISHFQEQIESAPMPELRSMDQYLKNINTEAGPPAPFGQIYKWKE